MITISKYTPQIYLYEQSDYIIYIITLFLYCFYVCLFDVHVLKTACTDCL